MKATTLKKCLVSLLCTVLLLTAIPVGAVGGKYGTTAEAFKPVGEIEITWDADAAEHITLDGDLSDWANYAKTTIDANNMISWVGSVPEDWQMECAFVADPEKLYVGFYITDDKACTGDNPLSYNGDAFQIAFDWNGNIANALEQDEYAVDAPRPIFYSFCLTEDGTVKLARACSEGIDGLVYDGNDAEVDEDEAADFGNYWIGADGRCAKTDTGWCAEISIEWQRLANDCRYKVWDDYLYTPAEISPNKAMSINCTLYYLNRDEDNSGVTWAAGTIKGETDEYDVPQVAWTPDEAGIDLVLKYQDGMSFAEDSGITLVSGGATSSGHETESKYGSETEPESQPTRPTEIDDSTWSNVHLEAFVCQDSNWILCSQLVKEYENVDWYGREIPELDGEERELAWLNMRGFAVTPDCKYALMGHLNGSDFRGCALYDFATGKITDVFYRYDDELEGTQAPFSYPKGIAADDRGNAYVGFAISSNKNFVSLGIAHINDETKSFEQLYMDYVCDLSGKGDATGGANVGVNGVEVVKLGDKYYCYIMINYNSDVLYCYDVTDPAAPVLNTSFGDNGKIDFGSDSCSVKTNGFTLNDGDYLAVDEDGVIWLAASSREGGRGVMKISADGKTCLGIVKAAQAYSVCRTGDYLLIGDKNGAAIHVYNVNDLSREISAITMDEDTAAYAGCRFARVQVIGDILFALSSQENDTSCCNAILVAPLTPYAAMWVVDMANRLEVQTMADKLKDIEEGKTEPSTEPSTEPATEPKPEAVTESEPATEPAPATEPVREPVIGVQIDFSSFGCSGSINGVSLLALITLCGGAVLVLKKKKDE